jgi:spore germination cell wall hydrolase CwlJ-like protein
MPDTTASPAATAAANNPYSDGSTPAPPQQSSPFGIFGNSSDPGATGMLGFSQGTGNGLMNFGANMMAAAGQRTAFGTLQNPNFLGVLGAGLQQTQAQGRAAQTQQADLASKNAATLGQQQANRKAALELQLEQVQIPQQIKMWQDPAFIQGAMGVPPGSAPQSTIPTTSGGNTPPMTPFVAKNLPAGVTPQEDQMTRTVIGESGGEPLVGQQGVASVIKNRMASSGGSAQEVIFAPGQFEPWNNAQTRAKLEALDPNSADYQTVLTRAVRPVMSGQVQDPTAGATHFYSPTAQEALGRGTPSWAENQQPTQVIGRHMFYKLGYGAPTATAQGAPAQPPAAVAQPPAAPAATAQPPEAQTPPGAPPSAAAQPPGAPPAAPPTGNIAPDQSGYHTAQAGAGVQPPPPGVKTAPPGPQVPADVTAMQAGMLAAKSPAPGTPVAAGTPPAPGSTAAPPTNLAPPAARPPQAPAPQQPGPYALQPGGTQPVTPPGYVSPQEAMQKADFLRQQAVRMQMLKLDATPATQAAQMWQQYANAQLLQQSDFAQKQVLQQTAPQTIRGPGSALITMGPNGQPHIIQSPIEREIIGPDQRHYMITLNSVDTGQPYTRPQGIPAWAPPGTLTMSLSQLSDGEKEAIHTASEVAFGEKASERYAGAANTQRSMEELETQFDRLNQTPGWYNTGTGANFRLDVGKTINGIANSVGLPPVFDQDKLSSGEDILKTSKLAGMQALTSFFGGNREAASIVTSTQQAVPGLENTPQGAKLLVNGYKEAAQYMMDQQSYMTNWYFTHNGNMVGADRAFTTDYPPQMYSRRAISKVQPYEVEGSDPKEMSRFLPGTVITGKGNPNTKYLVPGDQTVKLSMPSSLMPGAMMPGNNSTPAGPAPSGQ